MILVPSKGPDSWRALLAAPEKHWREGYSAHALATSWEAARGFPEEIATLLERGPLTLSERYRVMTIRAATV